MKFDHPYLLFLLWGTLPLLGIMVYGIQRHKKILARFAHPGVYPYILPGFSYTRKWIKAGLIVFACALAILALAGPKAGFRWEKTVQKGVDIMIALDCSRSMLAQDVSPTRLTRAKREIIDLTRLLHSDRAGLVAFAGQAVLQCPLTLDYQAFGIFLDALEPDFLPVGGTNLTAALTTCYNGFDPESDTEKAIILITDGEDTAGEQADLTELIQKLAQEKIKIFAIGVGDKAGAPIPQKDGGFKKDAQGNIILSRVDEEGLKKITAMTQGRYVRSVAGDMDLELIYTQDILNTMERKELTQGKKKVWEPRFQWFLLPALALFLLELLTDHGAVKPSMADPRALLGLVFMIMVAGALVLPSAARADLLSSTVKQGVEAYGKKDFQQAKKAFIDAQLERPEDLRLYYNIGAAAYGAGEYDLAESNFLQAAGTKDKSLRQKALYNLANTRYRQGNLSQAITDYETLLKEFPEDVQAKENLDFVKQKQEDEKQKQGQKKDGDQNKEGQNKQNQDSSNQDQKNQDHKNKNQQDQDQQNQDQQNKGDQEDQKDAKGKQKDPGKSEHFPSDKGGQNQADQKSKGPAGPPPEPIPDKESAPQEGAQGKSQGKMGKAGQAQGHPDAGAKLLENRLNRLEDKPGQALIPQRGVQVNDKDW